MILQFEKGHIVQVSEHFDSDEFECPCAHENCSYTLIEEEVVDVAEAIRKSVGALKITSGFRCTAHNLEVGGKPGSQHLVGKALDLKSLRGFNGSQLAYYAERLPLIQRGGLGIAKTWIHVDTRGHRSRWKY